MRCTALFPLLAGLAVVLAPDVVAQSVVTQPPLNTFQMRTALQGVHPRLYFTTADTSAICQAARGPCKWFYNKAKSDFGGYKSQRTPDAPGTWKDYLFGFWGQFAMCMFYVVEHDTSYANCARSWALFYARRSDWVADDLVPMDITSGMALTYDILYNYMAPSERAELRVALKRSIDTIQAHIFVGDYWTSDFQNNHMHNRIHGIAHAALAMYGDDASINVQTTADLALGCYRNVAQWLSPDGSTHEGPGYWDYGYPWVVRTAKLFTFVTGTDPTAGAPHFDSDDLYRLYMCTPGWGGTFGIGDASDGAPSNAEAWLPAIVRTRDAAADSAFRTLMAVQPGGFYQQTMWAVLWYDPTLSPQPYSSLPLHHLWPDLEMFSVRSSWADTATAFVFKCGPPGGNKMQQLRGTNWVNVAHDHPDQNHFMLFSGGRMLADDDGYPTDHKLTRSHNTIVIDSVGQMREGDAWYQPFDYSLCGHLKDVMLSGASAIAAGDASRLYTTATQFVRHIAFVEGGYVISTDELTGAGSGSHVFDWRLHKAGTWTTGQPGEYIVSDSANMRLQIRFLEPAAASVQGLFLPAESTAPPCLSARVTGASTRITAVLVPQHNLLPAVTSTMLAATGGVAVQAQHDGLVDLFAVKTASGSVTAGQLVSDGTQALVRTRSSLATVAMMTRGTALSVGGHSLLAASAPANLAWREDTTTVTVEVESPYADTIGVTTVSIGGLTTGRLYDVRVNGTFLNQQWAAGDGVVTVSLDLSNPLTVSLSLALGTLARPAQTTQRRLSKVTVYDIRGALVTRGDARSAATWRRAPGIYIVDVSGALRSSSVRLVMR